MKPPSELLLEEPMQMEWLGGVMHGSDVHRSVTRLGQMKGVFRDEAAWQSMNPEMAVYSVQWHEPVQTETLGGLFWGTTTIERGCVGSECFMTRGHFHARRDRGEYYTTVQGAGMLVLMGEDHQARVEKMLPGSLHYIPGYTAHRTVNTGDIPLVFWACWPSDAGHDYETIAKQGFGIQIIQRDGTPTILQQ